MKIVKVIIDASHIKTYEEAVVGYATSLERGILHIDDEHTREPIAIYNFNAIVGYEVSEEEDVDEEKLNSIEEALAHRKGPGDDKLAGPV